MTTAARAVQILARRLGHLEERIANGERDIRHWYPGMDYDKSEVAAIRLAIRELKAKALTSAP